jgi:hypothetical protein
MRGELPIRIPLAGTPVDEFFTRQRDDYSCGPAAMTTVAHIFGISGDYAFYRETVKPDPSVGTPAARMEDHCKKLLSSTTTGCDCYDGGVAIANVIQGEDHYVVFLKKDGDRAIYYDPWEHELVIDKMANISWLSEKGDHDRWCINFPPLPDNSIDHWVNMAQPAPAPQFRAPPPGPRP